MFAGCTWLVFGLAMFGGGLRSEWWIAGGSSPSCSAGERRLVVEEKPETGSSVAGVARKYGINANQAFLWRRLYRSGHLGGVGSNDAGCVDPAVVRAVLESLYS